MSSKLIARSNCFPWLRPIHPRRKLTLRMDTTNHCNLRCSMCPMRLSDNDPARNWHHMSPEVFSIIQREVFPYCRTVGISCGAEPLTNPDFPRYLKALWKSGVPYREMVTNGTLLTPEKIQEILKYPPTTIFFSIDGASPETHSLIRDGADLNYILEMVRLLVKLRGSRRFPMVGFSTTLQRDNLQEMVRIVETAASAGAESAGFVPLVPYEGLNTLDRVVDPESSQASVTVHAARSRAEELGITFHLSRDVKDRPSPHPCPYLVSTVYIDPDGSLYPCPYWNTGNPPANVRNGFSAAWNGESWNRLRRGDFRREDNCLECPEVTGRSMEVRKEKQ